MGHPAELGLHPALSSSPGYLHGDMLLQAGCENPDEVAGTAEAAGWA